MQEMQFYTIKEAAEKLKLSTATVYKNVKTGVIKGKQLGGKWYITEESLKEAVGYNE